MQSASTAQVDSPLFRSQTYGVHAVVPGLGHEPLLQNAALVWVPPEQLWAEHCEVGYTHAPAVSQALAPQAPPVVQAEPQQRPPRQLFDAQALLPPHTAPEPPFGAHAPSSQ